MCEYIHTLNEYIIYEIYQYLPTHVDKTELFNYFKVLKKRKKRYKLKINKILKLFAADKIVTWTLIQVKRIRSKYAYHYHNDHADLSFLPLYYYDYDDLELSYQYYGKKVRFNLKEFKIYNQEMRTIMITGGMY